MAQEGQPEAPIEPEDPEFQVEEHVKFRRRQQILGAVLTKLISENLSDFKPIMNGTGYAYTTLKIRNAGLRQITDVIKDYEHLRKIDLGLNLIKEIPNILNLKYVVQLDLSRNLLVSAAFLSRESTFPYLKQINLQGNKIDSLPPIATRTLRKINLNGNIINNLEDFEGHSTIQVLQLRNNKLKSLKGLRRMPALRELYVADNEITSLKELQQLQNLQRINIRKNKITSLSDYPNLPSLVYLNLRQNQIAKVADLTGVGQTIKNINLLANPIQAELADNTKKQVWMRFRNFSRINKNEVTAEQRQQFDKQYKDRLAEQERERLEKQAAEKEAREQQEKQQS